MSTLVTLLDDCFLIVICLSTVQLSVYSTLVAVAIATGFSLGSVWTTIQHNLQLSDCELYLKDLLFHLIWFVVSVCLYMQQRLLVYCHSNPTIFTHLVFPPHFTQEVYMGNIPISS